MNNLPILKIDEYEENLLKKTINKEQKNDLKQNKKNKKHKNNKNQNSEDF